MLAVHFAFLGTANVLGTLKQFVDQEKIHPILVNFTAALVPVSLGSDVLGTIFKKESLHSTAWWTICFAALITPFTAAAGWLFWMKDDQGVQAMTIHKWLGTSLAVVIFGLAIWRWWFYRRSRRPDWAYLLVALVIVAALVVQGHLGGEQSFSSITEPAQVEPAFAAGHYGAPRAGLGVKDWIHTALT